MDVDCGVLRSFYPLPRPKDRVGPFVVERRLGEGGQGTLFEASYEGRSS